MPRQPEDGAAATARLRGRASDSAVTRELILETAAQLFGERGYDRASLNDIVTRSGMTKGAVYWHFGSKEDMALAVVRRMYERWPLMLAAVVQQHEDALASLVAISYAAADEFMRDAVVQASKRLLSELPPEALAKLPQPYVGWERALTAVIRTGQSKGQINPAVDADQTAQIIVAGFFGMQQVSFELTARRDLRQRIDAFWDLLLPRLRPVGDRPS